MAIRVGLDVSAVPPRPAGAGRYIIELARGLRGENNIDLQQITRRGDESRWKQFGQTVPVVPNNRMSRLLYEQMRLHHTLNDLSLDVMHSPHYTMSRNYRGKTVVTICDMTFFTHPEYHERSKVLVFKRAIAYASAHADALVCISQHTADQLQERFEPKGSVEVIELGIDLERFTATSTEADEIARKALLIDQPYVLFLGTLEPRKGVDALIRAFDQVANKYEDVVLVLAGQQGWHFETIRTALAESSHRDRIRVLGYVDDASVPALLRGATAVAYPSVAEGFGLPVLEALACGAPVVMRASASHMALFGQAVLSISDSDEALSEALIETLGAGELVADRKRKGLALASGFDWATTVGKHAELYQRLAG